MKALTIWQPWASLIMCGAKPDEFRGKSYLAYANAPAIGERIVVHAGARPIRKAEIVDLYMRLAEPKQTTGLIVELARPLLERLLAAYKCRGVIPEGAALGTAVIGQPRNAGELFGGLPHDSDRGDFNWAWPLTDHVPYVPPVECRGMQGFWYFNTLPTVEVAE